MGKATRWVRSGLTTQKLLVAILFVAIFAMAVRQPADTDTWWHLKSGQLMWERGEVLRADPFSHTIAGAPILYPALFQIFLWLLYQALGLGGLALLLAVVVTATFLLVYLQCEGKAYIAAFATLLAAIASSVVWASRPQLASLLLAAVVAYLLDHYKRTGNSHSLWPIPFVVVIWVNSHGGFVIAFLLMGCYLVGEALNRFTSPSPARPYLPIKPLLIAFLVSVPAVLLNPNTIKMIPYAFQTIGIGQLQDFIQEWATPDFHNIQFHPFIWLLLLTLAAMGLSRRRADWTSLALISLFTYMALLAVRNIALFALVTPPILTRHTVAAFDDLAIKNPRLSWLAALTHNPRPPRVRRGRALLNSLLLILVLLAASVKVSLELVSLQDSAVWGRGLPLKAAEYLRHHELPGKMFNTYNWGGYLIWTLSPDRPVFVDGRTDLYALNSQVLEDYSQVHWIRPGWPQVLDDHDIGYVVTERTGLLDMMLAKTSGWDTVYQDDVAIVYARIGSVP